MATIQQESPLLDLAQELFDIIIEEVAKISKHDLIMLSVTCRAVHESTKRFVFQDIELLARGNDTTEMTNTYAKVAQGGPPINHRRLHLIFSCWPQSFLRHTNRSLSIHDFYHVTSADMPTWISEGIGRTLLKPQCLTKLELDFDARIAKGLEQFLSPIRGVQFPHLIEATLNLQLRFLLKFAPDLVTFSNIPREGYGREDKEDEGLRVLDLTIEDIIFNWPHLKLPALPIEKLRISRERRRGPDATVSNTDSPAQMGMIMAWIETQPQLHMVEIPEPIWTSVGPIMTPMLWRQTVEVQRLLLAGIIAQRFPSLPLIVVGRAGFLVKSNDMAGTTVLEPMGPSKDDFELEQYEVRLRNDVSWDDPAWIEDGEGKAFIAVQASSWLIHEIDDNSL
ncbi:hypothetical protein IWZ01DRAFT_487024 [Phyllosticta capitalensis]